MNEIMELLNRGPGSYINNIYIDLESKILTGELKNDNDSIRKYILSKYITS